MRIRIVAGELGGRFLTSPGKVSTHPMSERARSAIFSMLNSSVKDVRVLDAYAGTGALGIEALSRGASETIFIESDRVVAKVIQENVDLLGLSEKSIVINTTVNNWLNTSDTDEFDLIFADPPYHRPQFSTIHKLFGLLKVGGIMILSHSGRGGTPDKTGIVVVDNRSYANACITFYRRVE